jgi:diadenosine tetraphosphatase ApaH/serine/threonine PP2A family protein phosphatase
MPSAVLSDIHGNLEALETVLADLDQRGVERVACLGDFVGYGGAPNECMDMVRPRLDVAVVGNHDLAACGRIKLGYFHKDAATAARWTEAALSAENHAYLKALPFTAGWLGMYLVHSSPSDPKSWNYVLSPDEAANEMEHYVEAVCLIGHSHYPGAFSRTDGEVEYSRDAEVRIEPGAKYLVNVPSVGQPRDGDPRAGYLLVDDAMNVLTHVRLEYDVAAAIARIQSAGLPAFLGERLRWGE